MALMSPALFSELTSQNFSVEPRLDLICLNGTHQEATTRQPEVSGPVGSPTVSLSFKLALPTRFCEARVGILVVRGKEPSWRRGRGKGGAGDSRKRSREEAGEGVKCLTPSWGLVVLLSIIQVTLEGSNSNSLFQ
jgi:hypothetical protein